MHASLTVSLGMPRQNGHAHLMVLAWQSQLPSRHLFTCILLAPARRVRRSRAKRTILSALVSPSADTRLEMVWLLDNMVAVCTRGSPIWLDTGRPLRRC